ncbi:NAD(P)/FAD-dependent oxidoreductase [Cohnella yongneupensis]|uniref:NAD(P)/FAD-dependent oxidoreductase n=1 Tax=Cohnella yongneupensis TaxID=425006 RepID=A0ABW0QVI9_9BACL
MKRIAVIGAGAMGLACAYDLSKQGYTVDIYERDDRIGGMSASFDFDGMPIERYYHFVCAPDYTLFDVMKELGIYEKLKWVETKMGFFYEGKLYKWGNPLYLLTFPKASLIAKLRYGLHIFLTSKRNKWDSLDKKKASEWIRSWVGRKAYDIFWRPLFDLKFYELSSSISAAWIGTRVKRVGVSRKNIFTERMGYIEGGSETLLQELKHKIEGNNGNIYLQRGIDEVVIEAGKVKGIHSAGEFIAYDQVVSTVPLPYVPKMIPALPDQIRQQIASVDNIGVVCVILKLAKPLSENFWMNINDSRIQIPGVIEYSNLYPLQDKVVYVPFYLHADHPKYKESNESFLSEVISYMKMLNSDFDEDWIKAMHVHRYQYAQPVCPPGFLTMLPSMKSEVKGLYMADTSYYYPEDRSISESMRVGLELAALVREG